MDQELLDLIARLDDADNPLTDEELAQLEAGILSIVADIDVANPTDDDVAVLTEARDSLARIREAQAARAASVAERAAAATALLVEMGVAEPPADPELDPEAEALAETGDQAVTDGDMASHGAFSGTHSHPHPAYGSQGSDETHDHSHTHDNDAHHGHEHPGEMAVAAASTPQIVPTEPPPPRLPTISRLAHRRPPSHRPVRTATDSVGRASLTAAADIPDLAAGQPVDPERWAASVVRKWDAMRRNDLMPGQVEVSYLGSVHVDWPEERTLTDNEFLNEEKINAVTSPQAIAAAGGICGPVAVDYATTTLATADRPVRDGMASFGAARGGLRYILPHTLAAVTTDAPAALWTAANDANPTSPTTKPHATFACQTPQESYVDAVTSIVQFGNFQARYFPEQIAQYLATVDAVHARLAEATLLAAMVSGSTALTAGATTIGSTREFLAIVDRASAAYRYRHRMADDAMLQLMYPEWFEDTIRADLARQLPGDSGGGMERLATADAQIDAFFTVRNIAVTTFLDSPTGYSPVQGWGLQPAGDLTGWPNRALAFLFHPGAWMFLDGGELNLGMVRDATLNRTNDFQMFSETFEKAIFRGHESLAITVTVCDSGMSAGTADTSSFCASGS